MKKIWIYCIIFFIIIIVIYNVFNTSNIVLYINWNIKLPKPNKVDVIYNYQYREGEDLEIWHYNDKKINKIINNKSSKKIDKINKEFIKQKLNDYYIVLDDNEKDLFNTSVNIDFLIQEENYFIYYEKDKSWILLVIEYKSKDMYYFNNIW